MAVNRLRFVPVALLLHLAAALVPTPAAAQPTDLLFSEYVEGSSNNKAIEIFNGTGAAIDLGLGGYQLQIYFNGSTSAGTTINLVGVVAPGDVFVVADNDAAAAILAVADQTSTSNFWNGDDAIVLRKAGAVVDSMGQVGVDPGTEWGTGLVSTQDNTLRRLASICAGDTIENDPFDPAPEWDGFANDTFDGLGAHTVTCGPPAAPWVINEILADPHPTEGDANGDGTVNTTQDEFVEIVNNSGADQDVSGWRISDAVGVRHVFPAGTVIANGCAVVVFAGGTPTGAFGGVVVETASTGQLGLNNGGDTVTLDDGVSAVATAAYGAEGGNDQSLTLDPDVTGTAFVLHTVATGSGGARHSPGTRVDGTAFAGCAAPAAAFVINEIHADPHPTEGDANGDGTVSVTQDEFVEIVNNSGADQDISGWRLSDAVGVRHVFPTPTVVTDGCAVVVFAGGTPTGSFGGVVVQTASTGQLGLNNGGDTVTLDDGATGVATASYGAEGGNDQSLTLDPDVTGTAFVLHTVASGSGGARYSPGTRVDGSTFAGCTAPPAVAEIYEIQGSGLVSPFANLAVSTFSNTVTALASNGFFMQTPDARADADPETSNGIFVFTGGAPGVAVGDEVDVSGQVVEFFNFTEFSNGPTVTFVSGGNPLPAAVTFDAATPSPDQPQSATEFERYEGMRIAVTGGRIGSGNQRFGTDPIAESFVVAGPDRPFREPGILFPGEPGIPVFDGNPEKFELDPDRLGLPNQVLTGGSSFDAEGVLGFEFNGYELWPTSLTVTPAPLPVPVTDRQSGEFTVGSLNLFRLFDDVDDPGPEDNGAVVSTAEYERRLDKFSLYIRDVMGSPDVLAVEEAEKLGVLEDLAAVIAADDPGVVYAAYLVEGNDVGGIDTGYLVRATVGVLAVTQLAAGETLSVDGSLLHDRPPLLLEAEYLGGGGAFPITVLALHQRSLSGIESPVDGPRVRQKRLEQAQSVAMIVQGLQTADPNVHLVVIGDLNAFEFSDGYVDVVGQIAGDFVPADSLLSGPDLVDPNLAKLTLGVTPGERYSFNFGGDAQAIDHALTSTALTPKVTSVEYARGNSDAAADLIFDATTPLRSSDHDGLVVFIQTDADGDGVVDGADLCPGTAIPEAVPTVRLLPLHYALVDGDGTFDTRWPPLGPIVASDITTEDTAGCSCDQIIAELGLGNGHRKFGCNLGVMAYWIFTVNH